MKKQGSCCHYYTPESGLIYTSPNTIEMKNLTANRTHQMINSLQEMKRLSFDSPQYSNESPQSPIIRRSPRIAKRRLNKGTIKDILSPL